MRKEKARMCVCVCAREGERDIWRERERKEEREGVRKREGARGWVGVVRARGESRLHVASLI